VFDWKWNYRDLTAKTDFADLDIFTVGRNVAPFYFNPLIPPPGTQPTVWLKKLIEVMCHAYFLGEGVTVLLMRAIAAAMEVPDGCILATGPQVLRRLESLSGRG